MILLSATVYVGATDMQAHSPCLAYIGLGPIVSALVGEDRGHEGPGMVDPQVGRLEGDHGV